MAKTQDQIDIDNARKHLASFEPSGTDYDMRNETTIARYFADFGYTPTSAEINSFLTTVGGKSQTPEGEARQRSMVANYVNAVKASQEASANDPTKQVLADEKGFFNSQQQRAATLEGSSDQIFRQLQDTFTTAPKLFGSLTPDQIDSYLAPSKNAALSNGADLQTAAARRGLTGSSTELNSIAENERRYRETVLNSGLQVGLQEQAAKRTALQSRLGQLQGDYQQANSFLPGSLSRQETIAGNQDVTSKNLALLKGSLPLYLSSYSQNFAKAGEGTPSVDDGNFFTKYIAPFIQPAATVVGGYLGGPAGAVGANAATGALLKGGT